MRSIRKALLAGSFLPDASHPMISVVLEISGRVNGRWSVKLVVGLVELA